MIETIVSVNNFFEIREFLDSLQYWGKFLIINTAVIKNYSVNAKSSKVLTSLSQSITMTNA